MEMRDVEDPGLEAAIDELFKAAAKYRAYVKRNHRERLAGVMFVRRSPLLLVYTESEKYSQELLRLTWDAKGDSFSLTESED